MVNCGIRDYSTSNAGSNFTGRSRMKFPALWVLLISNTTANHAILCQYYSLSSSLALAPLPKSSSIYKRQLSPLGRLLQVSSLSSAGLLLRLSLLLPLASVLVLFQNLTIFSLKKVITSYAINDTTDVYALKKKGPEVNFFVYVQYF